MTAEGNGGGTVADGDAPPAYAPAAVGRSSSPVSPTRGCSTVKVTYYVAASVDGFIAGPDGQILAEAGLVHVWVVGGGGLARALLESGDLTDLILTVIPATPGEGATLFGSPYITREWRSVRTQRWPNGVVQQHLQPLAAPG